MTETVVRLPFPISVNGAFKRHNGGHLSKSYKRWRDRAFAMLLEQRPQPIAGRVSVLMELCPPTKILRDIDNLWKGPLDLLVARGLIEDDNIRVVREITARVVDSGPECVLFIRSAA